MVPGEKRSFFTWNLGLGRLVLKFHSWRCVICLCGQWEYFPTTCRSWKRSCSIKGMHFTSVDVHTLLYLVNSISILITTQYGSTHVQNIPLYYVESANFVRVLYLYWWNGTSTSRISRKQYSAALLTKGTTAILLSYCTRNFVLFWLN